MASLTLPNPGSRLPQKMDALGSPVQAYVRNKLAPVNQGGITISPLKQRMMENNAYVENLGAKVAQIFLKDLERDLNMRKLSAT